MRRPIPKHWTPEQEALYYELLGEKPPPKPAGTVVPFATTELSAATLRERAKQRDREAAEQERREIEAANERQRKLLAFEARHYHEVERRWHEQQAQQYQGFHSRGD